MKKLIKSGLALMALVISYQSAAAPMTGVTFCSSMGDETTFGFASSTSQTDVVGNAEGLGFSCNGINLTITAEDSGGIFRTARQDLAPPIAGIGVDGSPQGDNWSVGEVLVLTFDQEVSLSSLLLNGGPGDAHSDTAYGWFAVDGDWYNAADYDQAADGNGFGSMFIGTTFVLTVPDGCRTRTFTDCKNFEGYLESVTVVTGDEPPTGVPEPTTMLMFGLGLLGLTRFRT
ncbi:PEP-CTERM sorting domain-containing protein [Thalassotalea mangrovi]|uniref:PEP-CTERM sorting domain-containing protein n=1 Tax=Thalassotalea mangrovi TaxID=2572245 RepID=A0A4U1B2Z8_9GAMM|nr:PEP-CTERM sorting domain-containing protein [Thalassotalea mangrovi]TKB44212.1 PEP-CTERM sorting domain-containing protein [Thalassotalea mangrovi]